MKNLFKGVKSVAIKSMVFAVTLTVYFGFQTEKVVAEELKTEIAVTTQVEKEVVLKDGVKKEEVVVTVEEHIDDFLKEQKIAVGRLDKVKSPEKIKDGQRIDIIRGEKKNRTVQKSVNFKTIKKKDSSMKEGEEKIVQKGQKGKAVEVYDIYFENKKEVKRELASKKTTKKPKNKVVVVGTKKPKVMYVKSTAYTASCKGCSGKTATGIDLKKNPDSKVIAVDPKVIPLGTEVWVEGYGDAIAADTGGAIKGKKIDVFYPKKSQAYNWGTKKKVKIKVY